MEYLNGKILQNKFLNEIKEEVSLLGINLTLAIISTGDNESSNLFIEQIKKMCDYVGYKIKIFHYEDISEESLYALIQKLNNDSSITSILLARPLLKHLQTFKIRNAILPEKDVDGINDFNRISYFEGEGGFLPATVLGIIYLLEGYSINIKEKKVVIVSRNEFIGKTLTNYFLMNDCTVTILHSKSKDCDNYLKEADIVVTAVGKANIFKLDFFKENSIIIDIGIQKIDNKYYGDVDILSYGEVKSLYMIKSIGGVGPMTIAALAQNILKSYFLHRDI